MAKCILMSIKPKYVSMILNKTKTIEVRKRFPSGYVGWVYIYCTKSEKKGLVWDNDGKGIINNRLFPYAKNCPEHDRLINGKVVARFWCDKVEEILNKENGNFYTNFLSNRKLLTQSCLTQNELRDYMAGNWKQKFYSYWYGGYAIHITNLEIFDKPKEISEFGHYDNSQYQALPNGEQYKGVLEPLTRAPQSWCYIEV